MTRRVPAFADPDQLRAGVDSYFEVCEREKKRINHVGLANHLGVPGRTLRDYQKREGYAEILEMAKQRIEEERVDMLFSKDVPTAGVIFDLVNNYGWKNPAHREHSGPAGGPIETHVISTPMPADVQSELDAHMAELASLRSG